MGMFDEELLRELDARAEIETGGNRRVLVERLVRAHLDQTGALEATPSGETTDPQSPATAGDQGLSRVSAPPPAHGSPSPSLERFGGAS